MEDQRNWGDASYKTYVRPLALPWGYTLSKGSRHEQAVRLSLSGRAAGPVPRPARETTVTLGGELAARIPEIGLGIPAEEAAAALAAMDHLRELAPRFLVCNVDARNGRGLAELDTYRQVAEALLAPIVMEIVLPDEVDADASLSPIAAAIARAALPLSAIVVSSAADLKSWQPGAKRPERPTVEEICEGGARGLSRRPAGRRHALLLHGAQPQAAESGARRLRDPYDLLDRPCGR